MVCFSMCKFKKKNRKNKTTVKKEQKKMKKSVVSLAVAALFAGNPLHLGEVFSNIVQTYEYRNHKESYETICNRLIESSTLLFLSIAKHLNTMEKEAWGDIRNEIDHVIKQPRAVETSMLNTLCMR